MVVFVVVAVVDVTVSTMLMAVPLSMAVVEEEGEHTQETELGVHLDSHRPLTSGPLHKQRQFQSDLVLDR